MTSFVGRIRHAADARDDIPLIAAITAVTAWGVGPLMTRAMSVSTQTLVFWRLIVGVPLMAVIAYATGGGFTTALLKRTAVPGILFSLSMMTGFASVQRTSVANATLITTLQPALVLLVAPRLFNERWRRRTLVLSGSAFAGVLLVVLAAASTSGAHVSGDLLALANVCIWTTYFVMTKRLRNEGIHSWSFLAAVFLWSNVVVVPWALLTTNDIGQMNKFDWIRVVGMAAGPGVVGHGAMTWAQRHIDVTLASLLGLMSPVISTVGAWIIFDQTLRPLQVLGGAVVLASLYGLIARPASVEDTEPGSQALSG